MILLLVNQLSCGSVALPIPPPYLLHIFLPHLPQSSLFVMEVPNLFETHYVMRNVWSFRQAEYYICHHDEEPWMLSVRELRARLGRRFCPAEVYRARLTVVSIHLYMAGHQRTAIDIIYEHITNPDDYAAHPPIVPELRRWDSEELRIADAANQ